MRLHLAALAGLMLLAAARGGSDRAPEGYAVRLRIVPAAGGGVQRIALPPMAIVALRNRDGSDVRVFDARGRAVAIARVDAGPRTRSDTITASPILGGRDDRLGARVSVRLDERGQARVAEVSSAPSARSDDVAVLGALLDARGVSGAAGRLTLDTDIPAGQPVRFTIEASRDLDVWRPLGERVLYRTPGARWTGGVVDLHAADLEHDYLRVSWSAASKLIAPVTVRRAALVSVGVVEPIDVEAMAPPLIDDHSVEFLAPAAALSSLRVIPAAGDGPMPVRVLGRESAELPWVVLTSGLARPDGQPLSLDGTVPRIMRIEADRRGPGFSAPPMLRLGFSAQAIAFLASGTGSYTLATGREGAADMFMPLHALAPTGALPLANVQGASGAASLLLVAPDGAGGSRLNVVLWAVLLAAVALLAGLVWVISRPARRHRDPLPQGDTDAAGDLSTPASTL